MRGQRTTIRRKEDEHVPRLRVILLSIAIGGLE